MNPLRMFSLRIFAALLATAGFALPVAAQEPHRGPDHNQIRGARGDVHLNVGPQMGTGLRVDIPLAPNGLVVNANDELALTLGAELSFPSYYYDDPYGPYVAPLAALQWNFYVGPRWSVFPEAGVALYLGEEPPPPYGWPYVGPALALGARYHFNERNALLMRAGVPGGAQVGMTF